MLIAIFLLGFVFTVKANTRKCDNGVDNCTVKKNNDSKQTLPFHPENNLEQFIDSMAKVLNCEILIKESSISTTLNARPVLRTLFGKRERRRYVIRINSNEDFSGVKLDEVPTKAKIGLWFHELMHIKDYQSKSTFGILKRGMQYLSKGGKRLFEHEIDRMVIHNGYGEYLYHWSQYSMEDSNASDEYKAFKSSIYLTPEQIQEELLMHQLIPVVNTAY